MSATALMSGVKQGDESAFDRLYKLVYRQLYGFFYRLGFRDEVHDSTQEVLLRVFLQAATFDASRAKFETWMYAIAWHVAQQEWKRRGRFTSDDLDVDLLVAADSRFEAFDVNERL